MMEWLLLIALTTGIGWVLWFVRSGGAAKWPDKDSPKSAPIQETLQPPFDAIAKAARSNVPGTAAVAPMADRASPPVPYKKRHLLELTINGVEYDYTNHPLFQAVVPMIALGQWDAGRRYLQKIAYGIKTASEQEQLEFKHIMMAFAAVDPLYVQCMQAIAPILAEHPDGIRQTALYPHMAAAPDAETARYVLYFADELGALRRQKKGNSYLVFPVAGRPSVDFTVV